MMRKCDVRDEAMALAYLVDCTLATVCDMAMKKSQPKHEYVRQKSIAQIGVNWIVSFNADYHDTRVAQVMSAPHGGSVDSWASEIERAWAPKEQA